MENAIQMFKFENKQEIRVVEGNDGEPWFVAKDICDALGMGTEQIRRLDDDEKDLRQMQTPGGIQAMSIVSESGMYNLLIRSDKPEAKYFRKWVTSEVLPAIRKTGSYSVKQMSPAELLVAQAQMMLDHEQRLSAIEAKQHAAEATLLSLPEQTGAAPEKSLRAALNERVRSIVVANGADYTATWGKLYKELYYRAHFDVKARALGKGQNMLDLVEEAGLLPTLYAIACEVL